MNSKKTVMIIRNLDENGNTINEKEYKTFVIMTEDGLVSATDSVIDLGFKPGSNQCKGEKE
ncbi:MAG TPA: hypothetical protein VIK34_05865 [Clostridiaceae bacterium]